MKGPILGVLFITSIFCATANRVKRFSGNGQRNEWNWNRNEQLTDGQIKGSSQGNWPTKGNSGSVKGGRGDTNPSRDGSWAGNDWSSGEKGSDVNWNPEPQANNKGSAYPTRSEEQGGNLETLLRGVPGMDFPNFLSIPKTEFDCSAQPSQGYYGDVEAGCQVFHICQPGNRKDSFLCPVGTIFNQKYFVCDWWFNLNCSDAPSFYDLNNEVYKDIAAVTTEAAPVTTEKTLPWNAQDLDKKRPPAKSWNNPPSTGKQNNGWSDSLLRRGGKTDSREVSNNWSRSDVQQKEVTVAWGSSSGTSVGTYGSSSTASNAVVPTTKPIWYGIDGQLAKDQSNGVAKRRGMMQTQAPFGTRMKSSTRMGRSHTWAATESYFPTTLTPDSMKNYGPASSQAWFEVHGTPKDLVKDTPVDENYASREWFKGETSVEATTKDASYPTTTPVYTRGWLQNDASGGLSTDDNSNSLSRSGGWRKNELAASLTDDDAGYGFPVTRSWLKNGDIPETSIVPTGIDGVWEQETTRGSNDEGQATANDEGPKDLTRTASGYSDGSYDREHATQDIRRSGWSQRRNFRDSSTPSDRGWFKQSFDKRKFFGGSNVNDISRRRNWN